MVLFFIPEKGENDDCDPAGAQRGDLCENIGIRHEDAHQSDLFRLQHLGIDQGGSNKTDHHSQIREYGARICLTFDDAQLIASK